MKFFIVALVLLSFANADEMQRIESIVEDITKLRIDYNKCQESLNSKKTIKADIVEYQKNEDDIKEYQRLLKDEREKNIILITELDYLKDRSLNNDKIIKKYKKLLKAKENKIIYLEKKLYSFNSFPKLMPKEKVKEKTEDKIQFFKASSFRLRTDSSIYDSPNGKEMYKWEQSTSFTSNQKTTNWIKITGYFIDRKWMRAKKEMWVKYAEVSKR